jgi:outer membrane protein insertion porin family
MYDPNKVQHARNVLLDYLAERGRQFATVEPELHQVPPSALEIVFKVDEGPKVKVHDITFHGNNTFTHRELLRPMVNLHPIGIPDSIFFESIWAKTFDSTKLEEDQERLEEFYRDHGYFLAKVTGSTVKTADFASGRFRLPLIWSNKPGKGSDIDITIEEGRQYHLNKVNYVGSKLFKTPEVLFAQVLGMHQGDVFSTAKLRKAIEEFRKLYGTFGYIDFLAEPDPEPIPGTDKMDLTWTFDEGRQFYVRRIDFSGNTTTRDKVIRRQLLVDEGEVFNKALWEVSILRLNQLGYFEVLKEADATTYSEDTKNNTVDITLKVKERAKNSIQLQGGVSGISGSFVGLSYSTNNFLGQGETISISSQVGTRTTSANLSFTEPYFLDHAFQVGASVFVSRFNYNQAREASILAGTNLIPLYNTIGSQNLLNYVTNSKGFTVFSSYPLKRSFARIGLSYGYSIQNIRTLTDAASTYYQYVNFQNLSGPNALNGITTSNITPSYTYNSVNHPVTPTAGKSISLSAQFSGSVLGGTVNQVEPVLDIRYFRKGFKPGNVIAMHLSAKYLTGYGGKVAAPFNRFYMGGENDIRGFEIWEISPVAYVPTQGAVNVLNADGSPRQQRTVDPASGAVSFTNVTQNIPSYQLVFPGGDMSTYGNIEYRIPIFGPVTLAAFLDAGENRIVDTNQLQLNAQRIEQLNGLFPEAAFKNKAVLAPGTQALRSSTGLELQVLMPVVNAPFRVYFAYNPNVVRENLIPPIAADRSYFPNAATFNNALATFGQPLPYDERITLFRFTVGRTF